MFKINFICTFLFNPYSFWTYQFHILFSNQICVNYIIYILKSNVELSYQTSVIVKQVSMLTQDYFIEMLSNIYVNPYSFWTEYI